jgi:hypothetical protein
MNNSGVSGFQLSAADVLRAWNAASLRVIRTSQPHSPSVDAEVADIRLDHTRTAKVKFSTRKKTTIIRSSDTAMFGHVLLVLLIVSMLVVCQTFELHHIFQFGRAQKR